MIKIGRTQLEDAVPMRLGQSFHAYATMISRDRDRLMKIRSEMYTVNMGATAIGTAINTSSFYLANTVPTLARITGYPLTQADDPCRRYTGTLVLKYHLMKEKELNAVLDPYSMTGSKDGFIQEKAM